MSKSSAEIQSGFFHTKNNDFWFLFEFSLVLPLVSCEMCWGLFAKNCFQKLL